MKLLKVKTTKKDAEDGKLDVSQKREIYDWFDKRENAIKAKFPEFTPRFQPVNLEWSEEFKEVKFEAKMNWYSQGSMSIANAKKFAAQIPKVCAELEKAIAEAKSNGWKLVENR